MAKKRILIVDDEPQICQLVKDILEEKLVRRKVSLKCLDYQKLEDATLGSVRQKVKIQQGIESDKAKAMVKAIKDAKLKVQASIQGDQVRVAGKNKDDLQRAIQILKEKDFGLPLQFTNYR